jgi:RNA polymerase sigma-70 factor (ECF subfamily)
MSVVSLEQLQQSHARVIERLYAQARAQRWELSAADFAGALHRSVVGRFDAEAQPAAADLEAYLDSLFVEDLALAGACERGTQAAWIEFLTRYRPALFGAALALARDEARAEEITDTLYAELYGLEERDGRRRSLFQYFHGRSSLTTWLRSVVSRTFVNGYRAEQRSQAFKGRVAQDLGPEAEIAPAPADPDRVRYLEMLRQSLSEALAQLEPRERLRLSYYHVQELTLAQVGRLLGEHESTVSRKLEHARQAVRKEVERRLRNDHGLASDEVRACYQAALEAWPFDLTKELGAGR